MTNSILIDSHIFIWALFEKNRLSVGTQNILLGAEEVKVSLASFWELSLKHRKGKLTYAPSLLVDGVDALGAQWMDVTIHHILQSSKIRAPQLDPFDQMLVSQAISENLPLLTCDQEILQADIAGLRLLDGRS